MRKPIASTQGIVRCSFKKGSKLYGTGGRADNRQIPDIDANNIQDIDVDGAVSIILMKNRDAYVTHYYDVTTTKYTDIIKMESGNNGYALLQAAPGKENCDDGCTLIPFDNLDNRIQQNLNDGDPANDPTLTGLKDFHYVYGNVYMIGLDTGIQWITDSSGNYQSYIPNPPTAPNVDRYFITQGALAAIRTDKTVVALGSYSLNGVPDCSGSSSCFTPDKTLANVVDIKTTGGSFTAMINSSGGSDCTTGCEVTTWGYVQTPADNANVMGAALNLTDIKEVYTSYSSLLGVRTDNSLVVWGSIYYGADTDCSESANVISGTCQTMDHTSFDRIIKDDVFNTQFGFLGYKGNQLDYWGRPTGTYSFVDVTIPNLVDVVAGGMHGGIALSSDQGNCDNGCSYTLLGNSEIYLNGTDLQGQVKVVHQHRDYIEIETKDGKYSYMNIPTIYPQINESDYQILTPSP